MKKILLICLSLIILNLFVNNINAQQRTAYKFRQAASLPSSCEYSPLAIDIVIVSNTLYVCSSLGTYNVPNNSGETNLASNLGGGLANFDSKSGVTLRFNSFLATDFNLSSNLISIDYANGQSATGAQKGFLIAADWTTFNNKENALTFNSPLSRSVNAISITEAIADSATKGAASFTTNDFDSSSGNISLDYANGQKASNLFDGFLSSSDWNLFNNKQDSDADLIAIAALGTTGILSRTGAGTYSTRTLTGTANEISISNGDGISGNPTFSLPASLTFTGKTITGGTFSSPQINLGTDANGDIYFRTGGVFSRLAIGTNGQCLIVATNLPSWGSCGSSGANTALSNLASVAINTTLLSDTDNTDDLGSATFRWKDLFLSGFIKDGSGNELFKFSSTASAVNEFTAANAATGNNPIFSVTGSDADIGMEFQTKGTGKFQFKQSSASSEFWRLLDSSGNESLVVADYGDTRIYFRHAGSTNTLNTVSNGKLAFVDNGGNGTVEFQDSVKIAIFATVTAGGTTGNQTINKSAGTVNIAAGGSSVVVTNSKVTANSIIDVMARTNDATCYVKNYVASAGSFTINMVANCTAETSIGFIVVN